MIAKEVKAYASGELLSIIWHCFMGDKESVTDHCQIPGCRVFFSVSSKLPRYQWGKESVQAIPLDNLLVETDSPFIPVIRGERRGSPSMIGQVAEAVADIIGWPLRQVVALTHNNALRAYHL